jgi:hypothetical protein
MRSQMSRDGFSAWVGIEKNCIALTTAELAERAFQRAGGAQQMGWPGLNTRSGLFLNG